MQHNPAQVPARSRNALEACWTSGLERTHLRPIELLKQHDMNVVIADIRADALAKLRDR